MNGFPGQTMTPQRFHHIQRQKLAPRFMPNKQQFAQYCCANTPRHAAFQSLNQTFTSDGISPFATPSANFHDSYNNYADHHQHLQPIYYQHQEVTAQQFDLQQQQQWTDYNQQPQYENSNFYQPQFQPPLLNTHVPATQIINQQFNQTNVVVQQNLIQQEADSYLTGLRCCWVDPQTFVQCQRAFNSPKSLEEHLDAEHISKEKPYVCHWVMCNKQCEQRYKVVNHSRVHTGHKPFQCNFENCGKTFARSENLKIHQRVHTGEKPFKCKHCGRCFANSSDRKKHQHVHDTSGQQFICPRIECGKRYTHPSSLRKHVKKHEDADLEQSRKRQYSTMDPNQLDSSYYDQPFQPTKKLQI